jgi:exo-beta-1,3-glucanase (GH17 family)
MPGRLASILIPAVLVALTAGGAGFAGEAATSEATASRVEPLVVRPLDLGEGDHWIGNAISYGPHRDGQRPGLQEPSAEEIREDLHLMAPHWKLLRVYGSSGFAEAMLSVIREDAIDMKVMLGAWIARDAPVANRREVDTAIRLARDFPEIVLTVSVGNETQIDWSAHKSSVDSLIGYVRRARAGVTVPVTVADDFNFWNKPESRAVAAEIDFITMHAHPLWNGIQLEDALAWLGEQTAVVQALHPERWVVIGETGWATSVHDEGEQARLIKGQPGEPEQKQFHDAVRAWAESERRPVFFFEAFDENWKGGPHPAEVEKHWGLFRANRAPKVAMVSDGEE